MKLWKGEVYDPDNGTLLVWASSRRKALAGISQRMDELAESCGGEPGDYWLGDPERVEIPTSRAGLVRWLNTYLTAPTP